VELLFSSRRISRSACFKACLLRLWTQEQSEEAFKQREKVDRDLGMEEQQAEKRQPAKEREQVREQKEEQKLATQQLKTDARIQKQQEKGSAKQTRADKRARKGLTGRGIKGNELL